MGKVLMGKGQKEQAGRRPEEDREEDPEEDHEAGRGHSPSSP